MKWLDRLTRCPFHDRPPTPLMIAELEQETGINPDAVAELWATSDGIPDHYNPDLIHCGNYWCSRRRPRLKKYLDVERSRAA